MCSVLYTWCHMLLHVQQTIYCLLYRNVSKEDSTTILLIMSQQQQQILRIHHVSLTFYLYYYFNSLIQSQNCCDLVSELFLWWLFSTTLPIWCMLSQNTRSVVWIPFIWPLALLNHIFESSWYSFVVFAFLIHYKVFDCERIRFFPYGSYIYAVIVATSVLVTAVTATTIADRIDSFCWFSIETADRVMLAVFAASLLSLSLALPFCDFWMLNAAVRLIFTFITST